MEINKPSIQGTRPVPGSEDKLKVDVTRVTRERVQQSVEETLTRQRSESTEPTRQPDRLELSEEAKRLASQTNRESSSDDKRAARVRELKSIYEAGKLPTRERLEQAADRMLRSGE